MLKNNKKPKLKHDVSNDFYTLLGNVNEENIYLSFFSKWQFIIFYFY